MNAQEWQIHPASHACAACGHEFENGESLFSRLVFDAAESYHRDDLCLACREKASEEKSLSVWRTMYRAPAPPSPEPVKRETAESLLRKFMETEDPAFRDAVFVLAVMLERRRILVEREVQHRDDKTRLRVYEHRGTGETFVVVDPGLRLDALEKVQEQVISLLGGEQNDASPLPAPDTTDTREDHSGR